MKLLIDAAGLLIASLGACAQQPDELAELRKVEKPEAVVPGKVYTYVEQMPQLPGGGGMPAIIMEFQRRLRLPVIDLREQFVGRALIYFEVNPTGAVQHVRLLQSTNAARVDSALTATVRALPHFTPGRQSGQPVTVSMTLPITCFKPQ